MGSVTRTREWLGDYSTTIEDFDELCTDLKALFLPEDYYIPPQHVTLIVDGRCGSTCCFFVKRAQEEHLAEVIGLGANLVDDTPFDSANFCGGRVLGMDELLAFNSSSGALARDVTLSMLSVANSWSFDPDTADEWLEYKVIRVDKSFPIFSTPVSTESARINLIHSVLPEFDGCFSWEVEEADCTPKVRLQHAKYGYPCNSTSATFDTTQCVFSRCDKGYYLSSDHQCTPVKVTDGNSAGSNGEAKESVPVWSIVVISILGALLLRAVICIIILCICCQRHPSDSQQTEMKPSSELNNTA